MNTVNKMLNKIYPLHFNLSANAPTTKAGVIIAKDNWNNQNTMNGTPAAIVVFTYNVVLEKSELNKIFLKTAYCLQSPITPYTLGPNAAPKPNVIQIAVTIAAETKHCANIVTAFFLLNKPL